MNALNIISIELEMPFSSDVNHLPLEHFQADMNDALLMLTHETADHLPHISEASTKDFSSLAGSVVRRNVRPSASGLIKPSETHSKSFTLPDFFIEEGKAVPCKQAGHSIAAFFEPKIESKALPSQLSPAPAVVNLAPAAPVQPKEGASLRGRDIETLNKSLTDKAEELALNLGLKLSQNTQEFTELAQALQSNTASNARFVP